MNIDFVVEKYFEIDFGVNKRTKCIWPDVEVKNEHFF